MTRRPNGPRPRSRRLRRAYGEQQGQQSELHQEGTAVGRVEQRLRVRDVEEGCVKARAGEHHHGECGHRREAAHRTFAQLRLAVWGRPRNAPEHRATAKPSKPPIHTAAATAWVQSARRGKRRPVAAAWLSPVSVIRSMALAPIAAHHAQVRPDPAAAVIAAAVSSAKASRASQTSPTLLSKSVCQNSPVLRGSPEARTA